MTRLAQAQRFPTPFDDSNPQTTEFWNGAFVRPSAWGPDAATLLPWTALWLLAEVHRSLRVEGYACLEGQAQAHLPVAAGATGVAGQVPSPAHPSVPSPAAEGTWCRRLRDLAQLVDDLPNGRARTDPAAGAGLAVVATGRTWVVRGIRPLQAAEPIVTVDGRPASAGLFDLTLTAFHCVPTLLARRRIPGFELPERAGGDSACWGRGLALLESYFAVRAGTLRRFGSLSPGGQPVRTIIGFR